jgi:hypothetical protein
MRVMNHSDQEKWLAQHIPHRLRVCLAYSAVQKELLPDTVDRDTLGKIGLNCVLIAAVEGRMAAIRWLIEFVGISGRAGRPKRYNTDVSITSIQGGKPIDPFSHDAVILAKVWKGCSQASAHPTQDTNHPPVDGPALDEALRIIVRHLKRTIYSASPDKLVTQTLVPLGRTNS